MLKDFNNDGLHWKRGPAWLHWRRQMAATVGGVLLDDVAASVNTDAHA